MKQMKTIQFPDESEPYEVVDEAARNMLAELENNNNFASKEWVLEQLGDIGNCIYGTENLVIGSSPLATGTFYFYINGDDRTVENVYIGVDDVAEQWKPYVTGEFTVEETRSYSITYEGDSPTVECPECLMCQDDGNGTLTFTGSFIGSGIVRLYKKYVLIAEYKTTVFGLVEKAVGELPVGSSVFLYEYSSPAEYIVVHQGNPDPALYDSSCDGTWLLRKDIHSKRVFDSDMVSDFYMSDIKTWLNGNLFMQNLDSSPIKNVKIPYRAGDGADVSVGANGLSVKVFLLSLAELGHKVSNAPTEGSVLSYFDGADMSKRIAYLNGTAELWWTRTADADYDEDEDEYAYCVDDRGGWISRSAEVSFGVRPACILPSNTLVATDGHIVI